MKNRTKYIVASIVLHLLLFVLLVGIMRLDLFADESDLADRLNTDPLVFELQDTSKPWEVVETPDDAKVDEVQDAELLSDKNARAQNIETQRQLELGEAFSKGDFEFRELPTNPAPLGSPGQLAQETNRQSEQGPNANEEATDSDDYYVVDNSPKFSREFLTRQNTPRPGANHTSPKIHFDNQKSYVLETGSFSFSTYDWEYAPYMLALKKIVEGNIFPPAAYYRMGIIEGVTKIRFRIHPDGKMTHLQLLDYRGHETLKETSVRALEVSAPFPALPDHFPDEYLQVTGTFLYPNLRTRRLRKG